MGGTGACTDTPPTLPSLISEPVPAILPVNPELLETRIARFPDPDRRAQRDLGAELGGRPARHPSYARQRSATAGFLTDSGRRLVQPRRARRRQAGLQRLHRRHRLRSGGQLPVRARPARPPTSRRACACRSTTSTRSSRGTAAAASSCARSASTASPRRSRTCRRRGAELHEHHRSARSWPRSTSPSSRPRRAIPTRCAIRAPASPSPRRWARRDRPSVCPTRTARIAASCRARAKTTASADRLRVRAEPDGRRALHARADQRRRCGRQCMPEPQQYEIHVGDAFLVGRTSSGTGDQPDRLQPTSASCRRVERVGAAQAVAHSAGGQPLVPPDPRTR